MLSSEEVVMAYRLLLGREPENAAVVEHHAKSASGVQDLRERFMLCDEFESARVPRLHSSLDLGGPVSLDVYVDAGVLEKMFARVGQAWQSLGSTDPFWSVLSADQFKKESFEQNSAAFYQSGQQDLDRMTAWLVRNGITGLGPNHCCCEYGCGTGRVTAWLASRFSRVIACDISKPHLQLAEGFLQGRQQSDVVFRHIDSLGALDSLEPIDLFFSFMVLQHNPPPVMAFVLEKMLHWLKPGGIAFFQLPTYYPPYRFVAEKYLEQPVTDEIEIHILPQKYVFEIAGKAGCRVLEVQPDNCLGQPRVISNTFLLQKDAP